MRRVDEYKLRDFEVKFQITAFFRRTANIIPMVSTARNANGVSMDRQLGGRPSTVDPARVHQ